MFSYISIDILYGKIINHTTQKGKKECAYVTKL